jgi:hypothetical protein
LIYLDEFIIFVIFNGDWGLAQSPIPNPQSPFGVLKIENKI